MLATRELLKASNMGRIAGKSFVIQVCLCLPGLTMHTPMHPQALLVPRAAQTQMPSIRHLLPVALFATLRGYSSHDYCHISLIVLLRR